ncbi:hypothetical protein HDU98_005424, partial [Podochytrium sp. JEL0797]
LPRSLCFGNRGHISMTSWKPTEGPHQPPLQGDSTDDFDWLNPLGAPIPRSPTLHPQWITILQRPPPATASSSSATSSCTPSPKKKLKTWTPRAD